MAKKSNAVRIKPVKLAMDKERTLLLDFNAFAELDEKYGSIEAAMEALKPKGKDGISIKALRAFLWAGLVHEDENLTEKQVGVLMGMANLDEIAKAMNEALNSSLPEDDGKGKNEVTPAE